MNDLLVVVDVQNDFINGVLGSKEAEEAMPRIIEYIREWNGYYIFTKDRHWGDYYAHDDYYNSIEGEHFPLHCENGTEGSKIPQDVIWSVRDPNKAKTVNKSTFIPITILNPLIFEMMEMTNNHIEIIGFATDICVISTALYLRSLLPETPIKVISRCCAGTTPEMHEKALDVMRSCCIEVE